MFLIILYNAMQALQSRWNTQKLGAFGSMLGDKAAEVCRTHAAQPQAIASSACALCQLWHTLSQRAALAVYGANDKRSYVLPGLYHLGPSHDQRRKTSPAHPSNACMTHVSNDMIWRASRSRPWRSRVWGMQVCILPSRQPSPTCKLAPQPLVAFCLHCAASSSPPTSLALHRGCCACSVSAAT